LGEIAGLEFEPHREVGQGVRERRLGWKERPDAGRPGRLQIDMDAVALRESTHFPLVVAGQRRQVPEDQRLALYAIADRQLDLRQPVADRKRADERAQLR